jgi:hypothetical protein
MPTDNAAWRPCEPTHSWSPPRVMWQPEAITASHALGVGRSPADGPEELLEHQAGPAIGVDLTRRREGKTATLGPTRKHQPPPSTSAVWGGPADEALAPIRRSCRVGPGNFTPSPSQIPDLNLSIHPARVTARRLPPSAEISGSSRFCPVGPSSTAMTCPTGIEVGRAQL